MVWSAVSALISTFAAVHPQPQRCEEIITKGMLCIYFDTLSKGARPCCPSALPLKRKSPQSDRGAPRDPQFVIYEDKTFGLYKAEENAN